MLYFTHEKLQLSQTIKQNHIIHISYLSGVGGATMTAMTAAPQLVAPGGQISIIPMQGMQVAKGLPPNVQVLQQAPQPQYRESSLKLSGFFISVFKIGGSRAHIILGG